MVCWRSPWALESPLKNLTEGKIRLLKRWFKMFKLLVIQGMEQIRRQWKPLCNIFRCELSSVVTEERKEVTDGRYILKEELRDLNGSLNIECKREKEIIYD